MFDTNAIFTTSVEDLINTAAAEVIRENSQHADLEIQWCIPQVVRMEREYQMRDDFRAVLKPTKKAEKLLHANWAISDEKINFAIASSIDEQLTKLNVNTRFCDFKQVDWESVVYASAFRVAPFERGDKEKGFRDAIVCESFYQLVASIQPSHMAALITGDDLIKQATQLRLGPNSQVQFFDDANALRSEINLRVSNVDAATANEIALKASNLFFKPDDISTIWFSQALQAKVWTGHKAEIEVIPSGAANWVLDRHVVGPSALVKKEGMRVSFSNLYYIYSAANFWVPKPAPAPPASTGTTLIRGTLADHPHITVWDPSPANNIGLFSLGGANEPNEAMPRSPVVVGGLINSLISDAGEYVKVPAPAPIIFEIRWSGTYGQYKKITRVSIDEIKRWNA